MSKGLTWTVSHKQETFFLNLIVVLISTPCVTFLCDELLSVRLKSISTSMHTSIAPSVSLFKQRILPNTQRTSYTVSAKYFTTECCLEFSK